MVQAGIRCYWEIFLQDFVKQRNVFVIGLGLCVVEGFLLLNEQLDEFVGAGSHDDNINLFGYEFCFEVLLHY